MNAQSKTAALPQTAVKNKRYNKQYHESVLSSSLKIKIGEFLLFKSHNWREFETILRKYIDQRLNEVSYE